MDIEAFFKAHNMPRQSFYKYYGRFKHSGKPEDLLPQKRGAKWKTRRPDLHIEKEVIAQRKLGLNRYEIYIVLLPLLQQRTPSPSGIYNILKRHKMNRKTSKEQEAKRKIIKQYAGELAHVDCHYGVFGKSHYTPFFSTTFSAIKAIDRHHSAK